MPYRADPSLKGKVRRRLARLYRRQPGRHRPERPMISFSFDDAPASAAQTGAKLLEARGLRGTYFISASLAGTAGHMGDYANREDIVGLAERGHEIACHTYSHLDCGRAGETVVEADIGRNIRTLAEWGVPAPQTCAYPYGEVGFAAKRVAARRFALTRAIHPGLIESGADLNQAPAVGIEGEDGERFARCWLERAEARKAWLILFTHGVESGPTPFGASEAALARLCDEAIGRGFEVVTVAEGARRMRGAA